MPQMACRLDRKTKARGLILNRQATQRLGVVLSVVHKMPSPDIVVSKRKAIELRTGC